MLTRHCRPNGCRCGKRKRSSLVMAIGSPEPGHDQGAICFAGRRRGADGRMLLRSERGKQPDLADPAARRGVRLATFSTTTARAAGCAQTRLPAGLPVLSGSADRARTAGAGGPYGGPAARRGTGVRRRCGERAIAHGRRGVGWPFGGRPATRNRTGSGRNAGRRAACRRATGGCQSTVQASNPRRSWGRFKLRPMKTRRLVRGSPSFQGPMKSPSAIMCTAWKAKRRSSLA